MDCHNADLKKGRLIREPSFTIQNIEQAENWQKVLHVLVKMPPEDKTQPDEGLKTDFLDDLSQTMVSARKVLSDAGARSLCGVSIAGLSKYNYKFTRCGTG